MRAVNAAAGPVPVLLCGSRGLGTARPGSDYDVVVLVPWLAIPRLLRRLRCAARHLSSAFGDEVSINPLPASRIVRRRSLYAWKLRREGRVLSAPAGFVLRDAGALELEPVHEFSYLASAALYLLGSLSATPGDADDTAVLERGVRKALLHLVQLRLLRRGLYRESLEDALGILDDERLRDLTAAPTEAAFLVVRDEVLVELEALEAQVRHVRSTRTNVRYVVLAALRGDLRIRAVFCRSRIDCVLAVRAAEILRSVPRAPGRPSDPRRWEACRAAVVSEWPDAHPLAAQ